jgi:transposase
VLATQPDLAKAAANDEPIAQADAKAALGGATLPPKDSKPKTLRPHGRRGGPELAKLPVKTIVLDPLAVLEGNPGDYVLISTETSSRLAYRAASFLHVQYVRNIYARKTSEPVEGAAPSTIITAPLPDSVWPRVMADTSVIAHTAVSKYGDSLPLHRQETISAREGFHLSRSTQCDWLIAGWNYAHHVVDAMFAESRRTASCVATDATGAPVRAPGKSVKWNLFVFLADHDHVVFRYAQQHTSETIVSMLGGYLGYVVADAHSIYNTLFENHRMTEVACWVHARRYAWRGLESERAKALELLSLIAKLFEIDRQCDEIEMPTRTQLRAQRATPYLDAIQTWINENKLRVDPRGPLDKAITYITNQWRALCRFCEDGRLPLHNNRSEAQLRAAVLGRSNWGAFANETGLKLYTTYRSLIASCVLHKINPQHYLEQMLRLVPHWSKRHVIELSPKYWEQTVSGLNETQRRIITAPWELPPETLAMSRRAISDASLDVAVGQ